MVCGRNVLKRTVNVLSVKGWGCLLWWDWQTEDLSPVEVGHLVVLWRTCTGNAQKNEKNNNMKTVNFVSPEFLNIFLLSFPSIQTFARHTSTKSTIDGRMLDRSQLLKLAQPSCQIPLVKNVQSVLTLCGFYDLSATCPNKDVVCTRSRMNLWINPTFAAACCKQMPLFRKLVWVQPQQQEPTGI